MKKSGLSEIAGALLAVGVSITAGVSLYVVFAEETGHESAELVMNDLKAKLDGDRLVVTGTMLNAGNMGVKSIVITDLSVGDLHISQNFDLDDFEPGLNHGMLEFSGISGLGVSCDGGLHTGSELQNGAYPAVPVSGNGTMCGAASGVIKLDGVSVDHSGAAVNVNKKDLVDIPERMSVVFKVVVESDGTGTDFNMLESVSRGDRLVLMFSVLTDGSTAISDELVVFVN